MPEKKEIEIIHPANSIDHTHKLTDPEQTHGELNSACKRTAAALQESEKKFKTLAENSPVGIGIWQEGVFKYANPRITKLLGYALEEFVDNLTLADIVHPDDLPLALEQARLLLEDSDPLPRYAYRWRKKNGEIINVEIYASHATYNDKPALIGTFLDVTDRKRMEEAMQVSEARYHDLFENANDGIILLDKDNNFREVNKQQENISQRLQQNIDDFNARELRLYKLAMSWGAVRYDPDAPSTLDQLMSTADQLMYAQKKEKYGKSCT